MNWATRTMVEIIDTYHDQRGRSFAEVCRERGLAGVGDRQITEGLKLGFMEKAVEGVKRSACPFCDFAVMELFMQCDWDLVTKAVMKTHENN